MCVLACHLARTVARFISATDDAATHKASQRAIAFFLVASPPVTSFASPLADRQPARGGGEGGGTEGGQPALTALFVALHFGAQLKSKLAFSTHSAPFFYQFHVFLFLPAKLLS